MTATHTHIESIQQVLWLIPALPLAGFLFNGLIGPKLHEKAVGWISSLAVGISFLLSLFTFRHLLAMENGHRLVEVDLFNWVKIGEQFNINVTFQLDPLSQVMLLVVTGVGFLIHVYSIGYMAGDRSVARYFSFLNLFTFAMLLLVMGGNYFIMFIGWEGVGLCSYLLIGFWFTDMEKAIAGKKAFITNRIGDFGFLLGVFIIYKLFGSLDFTTVMGQLGHFHTGNAMITAATALLFVGAMGKSAQIPLYVWLPDAMAGPTPVSALIHAATMVAAGVYMVARNAMLYNLAPASMMLVAVVGALTAIFAATIGLMQNDIKKVLAYSTVSQLGYMFLAVGVGAYSAGIFHLMTHAFFKGLLFLGAGSVIHAMHKALHHSDKDPQDMRNMGGLKKFTPVTFATFLVATIAIAGIPPFAGFFSKDEILWNTFNNGHPVLWAIGLVAAGLTAFYMFRLLFMTFFGDFRGSAEEQSQLHESPAVMTVPLMILAVLAAVGGFVGIPELFATNQIHHFLNEVFVGSGAMHLEHAAEHGGHHAHAALEIGLMVVSVVVALTGILVAHHFYRRRPEVPARLAERFAGIHKLVYNKYFVDELYEKIIINPLRALCNFFYNIGDSLLVEGAVNGSARLVDGIGAIVRLLQTGSVRHYLLGMLAGAVVMIFLVIYI